MMEVVEDNPFSSTVLHLVEKICLTLMRPTKYATDSAFSCFVPTTQELDRPLAWLLRSLARLPLYLALLILTLPTCAVGLLLWIPLKDMRRVPYRFSRLKQCPRPSSLKSSFSFGSANLCLISECMARYNNITNGPERAKIIGERIVSNQNQVFATQINKISVQNRLPKGRSATLDKQHDNQIINNDMSLCKSSFNGMNVEVKSEFPLLDILLIQEAWEVPWVKPLVKDLHNIFPYIVYDAAEYGLWKNFYGANSGLLIASKHPILEVRFNKFSNSCKYCVINSKGLLQVKVSLGERADGRAVVGYAATTHLQVYQGEKDVRTTQMNEICKWTEAFKADTLREGDIVAFDVLTGDFNADNMSPVDRGDWYHILFKQYRDICRKSPGEDHTFTIGTEMRQRPIYDKRVQTPQGLKEALEDPLLRQYYILDADLHQISPSVSFSMAACDSEGRVIPSERGGRRRIDLMLHHEDVPVNITSCNPVTLLAGLTDHIAMCLTLENNNILKPST